LMEFKPSWERGMLRWEGRSWRLTYLPPLCFVLNSVTWSLCSFWLEIWAKLASW
jgi:hypothetical protein